jgi:hypothetical protein
MKTFYSLVVTGFVAGWAATGRGSIEDLKQLTIDFTNAATAANAATWSTPDKLMVSKDGLGWDGEAAGLRDGWIQTKPLALGLSWRTPSAVSVRVTIQPPTREIALSNGNKTTPYAGDVYVRYSPDLKHWSSWQRLSPAEPLTPEEKKNPGRHFQATMGVSHRERQRYGELLSEYARLDVPWTSDEEAAVRWVLGREPDFFEKQIPFIGYVEFLFEGYFYVGQRVRSFHAEVTYGMGGKHSAPKDPSTYKDRDSIPWRFEAKEKAESAVATDSDHREWAERCLRDFESIRKGMTRGEVASRFAMDGGLQGVSPVRFVHPGCPYFKVDVEFEFRKDAADKGRAISSMDDKVIRVSKPYVERTVGD